MISVNMTRSAFGLSGVLYQQGQNYALQDDEAQRLIGSNAAVALTEWIDQPMGVTLTASQKAALQALVTGDGSYPWTVHPNLWCDLRAIDLTDTADRVVDASGNGNHFTRGVTLTRRAMLRDYAAHRVVTSAGLRNTGGLLTPITGAAAATVLVQGVPVTLTASTPMPALTGMTVATGNHQVAHFCVDVAGVLGVLIGPGTVVQGTAISFNPMDRAQQGFAAGVQLTASFTQSNNTVTATGTEWLSYLLPGDTLIGPDALSYTIAAIASNTSLTLTTTYAGTTNAAGGYKTRPKPVTFIGSIRVSQSTTGTFTGGSTALNATNTTTTYASYVDPQPDFGHVFGPRKLAFDATGLRDSVLHGPTINFDYDGGEALLVVATIRIFAPAADETLIGNSGSSSTNGFRLRLRTSGAFDFALYSTTGPVSDFSGNGMVTVLDGTWHQIACLINGRNQTGAMWEDGTLTRPGIAGPATCNTRESAGLHIGSTLATPTSSAGTSDVEIGRLTIFRWGPTDAIPDEGDITPVVNRLRQLSSRIPAAGDF